MTGAQEAPERETPAKAEIQAEFDAGFTELDVELKVNENMSV